MPSEPEQTDKDHESTAELLAEMTGRDPEEFEAEGYEHPSLDELELVTDGGVDSTGTEQIARRDPTQPVVSVLPDQYARIGYRRAEFHPNGDVSRSTVAQAFVEKSSEAAEEYASYRQLERERIASDMSEPIRPDPETKHWMDRHLNHRRAWATAIDLLWTYSEGEELDADALREALVRESLRAHRGRESAREHALVKASRIVREEAGLEGMEDERREQLYGDYR